MSRTVVSSKYQVVIPKEIRERIGLKPGQELAVFVRDRIITLVPVPTLEELRGIARGADTSALREEADRF